MSEQPTTKPRARGSNKATQAAAGVAGALAFLGIGWVMGSRSVTVQPASTPAATGPIAAVPTYPTVPYPGEWGDDDGPQTQWGTIPQPGSGLVPAQPGTGGVVPPTTGSGGSSVAGASVTTANATVAAPATTTAGAP